MEKSNMEKSKSVVPKRNPTKNPSKAQKAKAAKTFRSQNKGQNNKGRNWTDLETEAFAMILADSTHNFSFTLETKALKKSSNKEVFEVIQSEFRTAIADPEFVKENNTYFPEESATDLDTSVQKLRTKYNNLKRVWRLTVDRAKEGSGLDVEREPKWFQVLHPVLIDTNSSLDDISSGPMDTSLTLEPLQDHGEDDESVSSDSHYEDDEDDNAKSQNHAVDDLVGTETFEDVDNVDPGATGEASSSQKDKEVQPEDSSGKKSKTVIRPHEKRNVPRSQVQALGSLASGVNKMAETQTKRLKMQEESEKRREKESNSLLAFRREQAAENRKHELQLAQMYMQILSAQPAASYAPPPFQRQWPSVMGSPPPSTLGTHSNSTMGSPPPNPWNSSTMGSPPLNPPALYTPPNRYQHSDGQQSSSV